MIEVQIFVVNLQISWVFFSNLNSATNEIEELKEMPDSVLVAQILSYYFNESTNSSISAWNNLVSVVSKNARELFEKMIKLNKSYNEIFHIHKLQEIINESDTYEVAKIKDISERYTKIFEHNRKDSITFDKSTACDLLKYALSDGKKGINELYRLRQEILAQKMNILKNITSSNSPDEVDAAKKKIMDLIEDFVTAIKKKINDVTLLVPNEKHSRNRVFKEENRWLSQNS